MLCGGAIPRSAADSGMNRSKQRVKRFRNRWSVLTSSYVGAQAYIFPFRIHRAERCNLLPELVKVFRGKLGREASPAMDDEEGEGGS